MPEPHVVQYVAIRDLSYPERLVRLGRALVSLSHDLAESRRRVAMLERENAGLREQLSARRR